MSVVGSEPGMEARRVDADSGGARDGVARLSVRPLRGVELRSSEKRGSTTRAVDRQRVETSLNCVSRRGAGPEPHGTQAVAGPHTRPSL